MIIKSDVEKPQVVTGNCVISKSIPVLAGILSARYLHTGDSYVQVFPWRNPQVPVQVLILMLSPTTAQLVHPSSYLPMPHSNNESSVHSLGPSLSPSMTTKSTILTWGGYLRNGNGHALHRNSGTKSPNPSHYNTARQHVKSLYATSCSGRDH